MKPGGSIIAILGAESTGKTTLARELASALAGAGRRCTVITETLREFCDREGRTPRPELIFTSSSCAARRSSNRSQLVMTVMWFSLARAPGQRPGSPGRTPLV